MSTNTKTLLTVKTDKALKKAAQKTAAEIGIPLGTLVNAYLRQVVNEGRVEFGSRKMSKRLERELAVIERDLKTGKNISPAFSSAEDALAYLRSR